ncbi:MAG TPA: cytochrome c biogenesis heme-transporting ATPase CcmA [Methylophilus sp.]|nr:cytochrome c biogenesis heme-transporting ATPase CcmA [Methylophilus sp.]HQQ33918.1 cytochrome c biogenesis heme-transporting ATPase CcmA [Methylophilus sp.]
MGFLNQSRQLVADNLSIARGDRLLFKYLSFSLDNGSVLHLEGQNGSGKTSLLRTICGLSKPLEGTISWCGDSTDVLAEDFFQQLLYIGHLPGIKEELSAIENLEFSLTLAGLKSEQASIRNVLEELGLKRCMDLPSRYLSQGQKKRVALARLWLQTSPLWVLDEPFTALDVSAVDMLKQRVEDFASQGGIVIMTTHQALQMQVPDLVRLRLNS